MEEVKRIQDYSVKELREICQHSIADKKRDNPTIGSTTRIFSIYITRLFLMTKITPDQITAISVLVFFIGVYFLTLNRYDLNVFAALVIYFSMTLDSRDGEVARFRKSGGSLGGLYTEPVSHDIQYGFAFLIVAHGLVTHGFPAYYYILGGLAGITRVSFRLLQERFCKLLATNGIVGEKAKEIHQTLKAKSAPINFVYWANKAFFINSGVFTVIFVCALINRIDLCLWFFGLGYTFLWAAMLGKQIYQIKKENIK